MMNWYYCNLLLLLAGDHSVVSFTPVVRPIRSPPTATVRTRPLAAAAKDTIVSYTDTSSDGSVFLEELGLPCGLRETLLRDAQTQSVFSKRIWIVDNSGSMNLLDGHALLPASTGDTSRWGEVQETVQCHAQLAATLGIPTDFRLLNNPNAAPQSFQVGYYHPSKRAFLGGRRLRHHRRVTKDYQRAQGIMSHQKPAGSSPLHTALMKIRQEIVQMLPQLKADGMKVAIVIATDGCNHDYHDGTTATTMDNQQQLFQQALDSLQGLPVTVVLRLCTDYGHILDYYNQLDERCSDHTKQEVVSLDVLDDYHAEAQQVYQHNPWLNYALILHRIREMGQEHKLFDLLDERSFTIEEIQQFCHILFGKDSFLHFTDPQSPSDQGIDFVQKIDRLQQQEKLQWNPQKQAMTPWIDTEELKKLLLD